MRPVPGLTASKLYNATQMFRLGLGRSAGVTDHVLSDELRNDSLLEELTINCSVIDLVDSIKVGGQDLMCSNKGANIMMFHPEAQFEGARSFGFPLHKAVPVEVRVGTAAPSTLVAGLGIQPIPDELLAQGIPDVNGLGDALNVVFGLGTVTIAAGTSDVLTATSRRRTTLGALVIDSATAAALLDVVVEEITLNGRPLLGGVDPMPLADLSYLATDLDGRTLAQDVEVGDVVEVTLHNYNAGGIAVYGGIWCLPPRGA